MTGLLRAAVVVVLFALPAIAVEAQEKAVLIYPKERFWFRRAFYTTHQIALRRQLARKFDLEVHAQVGSADKLLGIDVTGARLLVISAHGDPFAMFFGADRRRTIDSGDVGRLREFFSKLDPDATIILQSCQTGRGFAWAVKDAAGPRRRVIAARGTVPWNGMSITSLDPVDVSIRCRDRGAVYDCTVRL